MLPPRQAEPPSNPQSQRHHGPFFLLGMLLFVLAGFAAFLIFRGGPAPAAQGPARQHTIPRIASVR